MLLIHPIPEGDNMRVTSMTLSTHTSNSTSQVFALLNKSYLGEDLDT
jgi:hypothetical protein